MTRESHHYAETMTNSRLDSLETGVSGGLPSDQARFTLATD